MSLLRNGKHLPCLQYKVIRDRVQHELVLRVDLIVRIRTATATDVVVVAPDGPQDGPDPSGIQSLDNTMPEMNVSGKIASHNEEKTYALLSAV